MINLMFIKNISRLDTIRFENSDDRDNYFYDIASVSIDSIYPPHFQNRIQLSIEDLSPSTKVNYLSLFYEGKYYYYFIDDINYINEGLYEIFITMDTIMTFMFDLNINKAILERHNIKRWNDDELTINRNYIRENLSKDDFKNIEYINISDNSKTKCVIFKARSELITPNFTLGLTANCLLQNIINDRYTKINDGTLYIILPLVSDTEINKLIIKVYDKLHNVTYTYDIGISLYYALFNYFVESPYIVDAYICDNVISDKFLIYRKYTEDVYTIGEYILNDGDTTDNGVNLHPEELDITFSEQPEIKVKYPILREIFCENYKLAKEPYEFVINKNTNTLFNIKHIPQLLDENYFRVEFGERLGYTTFPLSKSEQGYLVFKYNFDIISGNRTMCILPQEYKNNIYSTNEDDNYLTAITNQTKENLALYSDRFQNYMATNTGTLTTGVALARANAVWASTKQAFNIALDNNTRLLQGNEFRNIGNVVMGVGDSFMRQYNITKQLQIARENAEYTPDTTRQGNTFSTDLMCNSLNLILKVDCVTDIEYVAKKYEQYGYLVNKEVINVNLYEDFNTRLYYNVVKFNNIDIELNYINNQTLIQNIIDRLENGLRLWNIFSINIDDDKINYNYFKYDNVENDFI